MASRAIAEPAAPTTWPQWRGPTRDGVVSAQPAWPAKLGNDFVKQTWRVELGQGYSSPIVSADRVYSVESADGNEIARAFDRATGKPLWEASWAGQMTVPFFAWKNGSWVRCTPAFDGQCLYIGGMRDVLVCLSAGDGKERWRVDFTKRYNSPLPGFGFVSSPLVVGKHLYVQAGASMVKLDKATGQSVWRALEDGGGMWGSAFSSPMLAKIRGVEQLLVQGRTELAGLDPETGKVLWSVKIPAFRGMNIVNPTPVGDRVFTTSYGGGSFLVGVDRKDDQWSAGILWQNKVEGYMNTPAVLDGHAYFLGRDQRFHCLEIATGDEKWKSPERFGEYWSLAIQGKMLLALDQRGELLLVEASPEKFNCIDRRRVAEQDTWAHIAICGTEIYVRELRGLARWDWRDK